MSKALNMVLFYDHPITKSSRFSLPHHFLSAPAHQSKIPGYPTHHHAGRVGGEMNIANGGGSVRDGIHKIIESAAIDCSADSGCSREPSF